MAGSDARTTSFAMYLNELTLMSASFLRYSPSLTAAASVALARHTVGLAAWPESVAESSGYRLEDIQACLLDLHQQHVAAEGFQQQAMRSGDILAFPRSFHPSYLAFPGRYDAQHSFLLPDALLNAPNLGP